MTAAFDPRNPDAYDWDTQPTPPLDRVAPALAKDPNLWWRIGSGHHQNLFDEAIDRLTVAEDTVRRTDALTDELGRDAHRPERGRDTNIETRRIHARLRRILQRKHR